MIKFTHNAIAVFSRARTRAAAFILAAVGFVALVGCSTTKPVKLPEVVGANPTSTELVDAVNANSAKIQSIYASNASIGARNSPGWANCQLFFSRPSNLRLVGTAAFQGRVVDCGCDKEKFWFWSSLGNDSDRLYYCRLDEYQNSSAAQLLPVDPSWFPEAFGVVDIKPEEIVDDLRVQADGSFLLTVKKSRPDGVYLKRVYLEPKSAAIRRQDIQDPKGDPILTVECREQQYVESEGVVLPKKLEITCASTGDVLWVDLGVPSLNDSSKFEANVFQMPTDLKATTVNLGKGDAASPQALAPTVAPANVAQSKPVEQPAQPVAQPIAQPVQPAQTSNGTPTADSGLVAFPTFAQNAAAQAQPAANGGTRPSVALPSSVIDESAPRETPSLASFGTPANYSTLFAQNAAAQAQPAASCRVLVYDRDSANVANAAPTNVLVPETANVVQTPAPQTAPQAAAPVFTTPNVEPSLANLGAAQPSAAPALQRQGVAPRLDVGANPQAPSLPSPVPAPVAQPNAAPGLNPSEVALAQGAAANLAAQAQPQTPAPAAPAPVAPADPLLDDFDAASPASPGTPSFPELDDELLTF